MATERPNTSDGSAPAASARFPIYLDYNATTPLEPEVITSIQEALVKAWGNPSSSHALGKYTKVKIDKSREMIAKMINANPKDIIFMSGGTEANNVAIISAIKYRGDLTRKPHVITSNVEHDSVRKCLDNLNENGVIDLSIGSVNPKTGAIDAERLLELINNDTCLISIMHANNETGIIMPIESIGKKLITINESRISNGLPKIYFHSDSAQTIGKIPVNVKNLNVDYLTIVGHKFYGPRIGTLYAKEPGTTTPVLPIQYGGGQEGGFRSGTENTPMIVGLGIAASLVTKNLEQYTEQMMNTREYFGKRLKECIQGSKVNLESQSRLPNTLSFCLPENQNAFNVLSNCSNKVLASLGAACHSSNVAIASSILLGSGLSESEALRTIRFSVGRDTTVEEIDLAVEAIVDACTKKKQIQSS